MVAPECLAVLHKRKFVDLALLKAKVAAFAANALVSACAKRGFFVVDEAIQGYEGYES